jgi:hypothetical protein
MWIMSRTTKIHPRAEEAGMPKPVKMGCESPLKEIKSTRRTEGTHAGVGDPDDQIWNV